MKAKQQINRPVGNKGKQQTFNTQLKPCNNLIYYGLGVVIVVICCYAGFVSLKHSKRIALNPSATNRVATNLDDVLGMSDTELRNNDVALLNLVCVQKLPGASELNISNALVTLDQWAKHVRAETDRNLNRYQSNPQEYFNSEAYFRMLMMAVVFYEDFNIRYNPERISSPDNLNPNDRFFANSQDIFLHGLIGGQRMGTCSSMPVLYAAVGRRLGYPLKLVTTKAHLFLRWEDGSEQFNMEATGRGMNRYDDEHFKQWPFPVTEEEIRTEGYLKSLTASEELAVFLSLRGNCLKESGQLQAAANCYAQAARLAPASRSYSLLLANLQQPQPATTQRGGVSVGDQEFIPDPNPLNSLKSR